MKRGLLIAAGAALLTAYTARGLEVPALVQAAVFVTFTLFLAGAVRAVERA